MSKCEKLFLFQRVVVNSELRGRVLVSLRWAPIQEFQGDYIVTSTNRRLEGIHRKNWWGFAGGSSCDASLHEQYQSFPTWRNFLVTSSRNALKGSQYSDSSMLPFGACIITQAGPLLQNILIKSSIRAYRDIPWIRSHRIYKPQHCPMRGWPTRKKH